METEKQVGELIKNLVLLSLLLVIAFATWKGYESLRESLHQQKNWRRFPAYVTGTMEEKAVEVTLDKKNPEDPLEDQVRYNVPVNNGFIFRNWMRVDVLENPANPSERKLDYWLDTWANTFAAGLAVLLSLMLLYVLLPVPIGQQQVWTANGWQTLQNDFGQGLTPIAQIHSPTSFWKVSLVFGLVMGGLLLASAIFGTSFHLVFRILFGFAGFGLLGIMGYGAVENYTLQTMADSDGITQGSLWGAQRVAWKDIASLHVDAPGKLLQAQVDLTGMDRHQRRIHQQKIRETTRFQAYYINFLDKQKRVLLRVTADAEPAEERAKLLALARSKLKSTNLDEDQ